MDWICRSADEVADETVGGFGTLTAEEKDRHRALGEYDCEIVEGHEKK
jgi:hypothetical protein